MTPRPAAGVAWRQDVPRPEDLGGGGSPETTRCLWWRGEPANATDLERRVGLEEPSPTPDLLTALWLRFGERAPELLEGVVAFVLWDETSRSLVLVRDRLGCEPLYFCILAGTVGVSPEALTSHRLAGGSGDPEPARGSLARHLIGDFPHPADSYFRGVSAVEPAEIVLLGRGGVRRHHYWRLPLPAVRDAPTGAAEVEELLGRVLRQTVDPGSFALTLSGGLDSPNLARRMAREFACEELRAFTWVADQVPEADERERAAAIATRFGFRQHFIDSSDSWTLAGGCDPHPESPYRLHFAELWDTAYAWVRREGLRGLVTGAGGDHLFGFGGHGAYAYVDLLLAGRWGRLARELREHRGHTVHDLRWILYHQILTPIVRLALPRPKWTRPLPPWLGPVAREALRDDAGQRPPTPPRSALPARRHRWRILSGTYLANVLVAMRRHAARYDLELRHPWLDHRLVELAVALPSTEAYRAGGFKEILRRSLEAELPADVVRARGRDRTSPLAHFHRGLREKETEVVRGLFTEMRAADLGLVQEEGLRRVFEAYVAGRDDFSFWPALTLECWLRGPAA